MPDDDRAARIAEIRALARSYEALVSQGGVVPLRPGSLLAALVDLLAERDAVREALGCADDETTLAAVQELQMERQHYVRVATCAHEETIPRLTAERDAARSREAAMEASLSRLSQDWHSLHHEANPDRPKARVSTCTSRLCREAWAALLLAADRPGQEGGQ